MGPIASGKSAVAARLKAEGCPVVDADLISHEIQSDPRSKVGKRLVAEFGSSIVGSDGKIDRAKIGEVVFADPDKLKRLNQITHGPILQEIIRQTFTLMLKHHRQIALDIPLLAKIISSNPRAARWLLSGVLAVLVPPETQLKRLMARNNFSEEEAKRRISTQLSGDDQRKLADWVLENDCSLEELQERVAAFLRKQPRGWSLWEVVGVTALLAALSAGVGSSWGTLAGVCSFAGLSAVTAKL